jgi:hypothetical protein
MKFENTSQLAAVGVAVATLTIAGCGGGGSSSSTTAGVKGLLRHNPLRASPAQASTTMSTYRAFRSPTGAISCAMISRGGLHNAGCYSDYTSRLRGRETVAGGRRWRSNGAGRLTLRSCATPTALT